MKKTILFFLFAFIPLFCGACNTVNEKSFSDISLNESETDVNGMVYEKSIAEPSPKDFAILILLYPHIDKAIQDYYGEPTQSALYDATVNFVLKANSNFQYRISVSVPTFHGPHNPPYGLETMTFLVKPGEVVLEEYIHKDV